MWNFFHLFDSLRQWYANAFIKMSKTIKKGEKENGELKKKCEQTEIALIELAEEVIIIQI
jgi:hypothetical protein